MTSNSQDTQPETNEEIIEECVEVLSEPYDQARQLHINNEAATGERDWMGLTNFRDALDHMSKILDKLNNGNPSEAKAEVAEMQAHIYRAIYDGAQVVPESKIEYIEDNRLPYILYLITLTEAPNNKEYRRRKNQIGEAIKNGRNNKPKNWKQSVKYFQDAKRLSTQLEEETPPRKEVYYRLIILGFSLVSVMGVLFTTIL